MRANCFTGSREGRQRLDGLRVFQQAYPPQSDHPGADYRYWPCTDAVTAQDLGRSTWTGGNIWALVWANRCNGNVAWNQKPNPLPAPTERVGGVECRAVFTSHAKANAATRCQVRHLLGMSPAEVEEPWMRLPDTSREDFIGDAAYRRAPGAYCRANMTWRGQSYRVMVDKVLLSAEGLDDGANADNRIGVMLDYEVQDSRSPEATEGFIHALAHDFVQSDKYLALFTNPFDAPTQQYTGCTSGNLPRILADVDYLGLMLWSGDTVGTVPESYVTQLDILGPLGESDYDRLIINFELGDPGTTLEDARWLNQVLHASGPHPSKVMFWRNHATQGGDCDTSTNRKIAAVAFGE